MKTPLAVVADAIADDEGWNIEYSTRLARVILNALKAEGYQIMGPADETQDQDWYE